MPYFFLKNKQKGVALVISIMTMAILIFIGYYFIGFSLSGAKIFQSQAKGVKAYYLAEAGINEAIWKIKNDQTTIDGDDAWSLCFVSNQGHCPSCDSWADTFIRDFGSGLIVEVTIKNSQCGRGEIIATSSISLSGEKAAQRVVKVQVWKTMGSAVNNSPIFSGSPSGEISMQFINLNIFDGNIFSNNNITVKNWSELNVYDDYETSEQEGQVLANGNVIATWSSIIASTTCSKNTCGPLTCEKCPPDKTEMPGIDFDSASERSYLSKSINAQSQGQCLVMVKNWAGALLSQHNQCFFTENQFDDLLWQAGAGGKVVLSHQSNGSAVSTYYIDGGLELKGGRELEINGILVLNGTVDIGEKSKWDNQFGLNHLTINDPGTGIPSGILTKGKINFGLYSSLRDISITGFIYAQNEIRFISIPNSFNLTGGVMGRKISFSSLLASFNIYFDNGIIQEAIWGGSEPPENAELVFSPIIVVDHWEELY